MTKVICSVCHKQVDTYKGRIVRHKVNEIKCAGSARRINLMPSKNELQDIINKLEL